MTEPTDASASTRPISVAELLAKNGTIGAPPVGGRRRRRRGNSDAVTVAELTGEIPIYSDAAETADRAPAQPSRRAAPEVTEPAAESAPDHPDTLDDGDDGAAPADLGATPDAGVVEAHHPATVDADAPTGAAVTPATSAPAISVSDAEADYAAHLAQRDVDPDPIDFAPPSRRLRAATTGSIPATSGSPSSTGSTPSISAASPAGGAEQMSPDPVVDDDELLDLGPDVDFNDVLDQHASDVDEQGAGEYELPSYLRSSADTLFGGQSVADDLARRPRQTTAQFVEPGGDENPSEPSRDAAPTREQGGSAILRGIWIVVQCILAVAFGAGLFIAFNELWDWNQIVALVLSVLVILGLVVGVRVARKTEDIGSTLIAVAVGALVTLGPLALLHSR